jgi:hypothetical protein
MIKKAVPKGTAFFLSFALVSKTKRSSPSLILSKRSYYNHEEHEEHEDF